MAVGVLRWEGRGSRVVLPAIGSPGLRTGCLSGCGFVDNLGQGGQVERGKVGLVREGGVRRVKVGVWTWRIRKERNQKKWRRSELVLVWNLSKRRVGSGRGERTDDKLQQRRDRETMGRSVATGFETRYENGQGGQVCQ